MNGGTVLILADDLSGAADASSAFAMAGLETVISLDYKRLGESLLDGVQVLAIDTDTRRLAPERACEVQLESWKLHRGTGQLLFKKMDSTLRGHFAAETAALIAHAGMAIVAPAFPAAKRVTRGGKQLLDGVSLESTEIWRSEGLRGVAHMPTQLQAHGIKTAQLSVDDLHSGTGWVRERLARMIGSGVQAVVCDAEDDSDLRAIVQSSLDLNSPHFWVGSAGLAPHLAQAPGLGAQAYPDRARAAAEVQVTGSILTVVGSVSSISRAQVDHLQADAPHQRVDVPVTVLRNGPARREWDDIARACGRALRADEDLLVVVQPEGRVNLDEAGMLSQSLARLFGAIDAVPGGIIATGGETARAVLTTMGINGLHLVGDIETGVPLSVALGGRRMPVITKAGAFGSVETLSRCHQYLRKARSRSPSQERPS